MAEILLAAEPRKIIGKQVKTLRRTGKVPVVLYGHARQPLSRPRSTSLPATIAAPAPTSSQVARRGLIFF